MGWASGRHALITGGGSGIGAATARALAREGARVSLLGRRPEPLEAVAAETGGRAFPCDLCSSDALAAAYAGARAAHGPISLLIVNAGVGDSAPVARTTREQWDRIIATNLTAAFDCVREALPDLSAGEDSRIVFVASVSGLRGVPYAAAYAASKHGLIGFMRSVALEYVKTSMTVNSVCPAFVDTPMTDESTARISAATGRSENEARASLAAMNPNGRFVMPEEVADVIAMLCRPESGSITGTAIPIDGGVMA
jgi:3-hydroxybutyrate dehydrogenase